MMPLVISTDFEKLFLNIKVPKEVIQRFEPNQVTYTYYTLVFS